MSDTRLDTLHEKVIILNQTVMAHHDRNDRMEKLLNEKLKEVSDVLRELSSEIKIIDRWMNRSKGWAAAALLLGGGAVGTIITKLFQ